MKLAPGLTFSLRRASGLTRLQTKVSRKIGIPLTQGGRQKKVGRFVIEALRSLFRS